MGRCEDARGEASEKMGRRTVVVRDKRNDEYAGVSDDYVAHVHLIRVPSERIRCDQHNIAHKAPLFLYLTVAPLGQGSRLRLVTSILYFGCLTSYGKSPCPSHSPPAKSSYSVCFCPKSWTVRIR